ncbi:MAG: GNAT family N-acetyltransferase, partial [Chlamydiales bacterium]
SPICFEDVDDLVQKFCFPWDSSEKTREKWERYIDEHQKKIRTVAIAKCNGEIIGYGSLLLESEYPLFLDVPEINDVWIHENHRGMGYGTALIKWLEALAKEQGYKEVGIGVGLYADYGPAQKLYFKLGYVPDGYGITYKCKKTVPGTSYPLNDDIILWLKKPLERGSS